MMFGKSDTTRVTDTITYITNQGPILGIPVAVVNDIVNMINTQFPRLTQSDRAAYSQLSSDMSVKGAIASKAARGSADERERRRAIFLLWSVIGKSKNDPISARPRAQSAMTVAVGVPLDNAFADVMLKAAASASNLGAQHAFDQLSQHPMRFIKRHTIIVLGSTTGGPLFSTAPTGNYQNVLQFYFSYEIGNDRFVLNCANVVPVSHPFQTVSVPAVHWTDVPGVGAAPGNFAGILGCEVAGANFMVTTQFTGCAFSWTDQGGVLRASHVSPAGGKVGGAAYPGGGNGLAQRIVANGAHSNAGAGGTAATVFGVGAGNANPPGGGNSYYPTKPPMRWTTIFGTTKGGGGWRLYTQAVDQNMHPMLADTRRIL